MSLRTQAVRVGLFAIAGIALLVAVVVVVFGARVFTTTERAVMHFSGSVYGLQVGSPVVFRGVRLGLVRSVGLVFGDGRFKVPVVVDLDRDRIRTLAGDSAAGDPALSLPSLVAQGLSGQLATHSLLTGQLYVDLDLRTPAAAAVRDASGMIEIPTTPTRFQSLQDQLDRVDVKRMADDLAATLAAARSLMAGPEIRQAFDNLAQASTKLARLAQSLDQRIGPLADSARGTLKEASQASQRVGAAAERMGTSVAKAADRVASAAASADGLLSPGSPTLASVRQAADELARSAAALREAAAGDGGASQSLQRTLGDVSRAARALRDLAQQLEQQPQSLIRGREATP
jgi:paraquat-inducible protein B